jgi:hypothetical protein
MNEIVIDIAPNGRVHGMHRDVFDLSFLGPQRISRASDIQFDFSKQEWRIWLPAGNEIGFTRAESVPGFPTYCGARDFEVLWLNECLKAGFTPLSAEGQFLGQSLYYLKK